MKDERCEHDVLIYSGVELDLLAYRVTHAGRDTVVEPCEDPNLRAIGCTMTRLETDAELRARIISVVRRQTEMNSVGAYQKHKQETREESDWLGA